MGTGIFPVKLYCCDGYLYNFYPILPAVQQDVDFIFVPLPVDREHVLEKASVKSPQASLSILYFGLGNKREDVFCNRISNFRSKRSVFSKSSRTEYKSSRVHPRTEGDALHIIREVLSIRVHCYYASGLRYTLQDELKSSLQRSTLP